MVRASPSWAQRARRVQSALLSFASVATHPIVVADARIGAPGVSPASRLAVVPSSAWPSAVSAPAIGRPLPGSITSPTAFTAIRAAMVMPSTLRLAVPIPPFIERPTPHSLPTVAPAPAPTEPSVGLAVEAASQARRPLAASGRTAESPIQRSNRIAAGTIGTHAGPTGSPIPRSSSQSTTPVAAARPNALPPDNSSA